MTFVQIQVRDVTPQRYFVGLTGPYRLQLRAWSYKSSALGSKFIKLKSDTLRINHGTPELTILVGIADMVRAAMPWIDTELDSYIDLHVVNEDGSNLASFEGMNLYFEAIPADEFSKR